MNSKDSFLMLTKEQKRSGRVYLTEGQLKFLKSKIGPESVATPPINAPSLSPSPPLGLTELKVYDDSKDLFSFCYKLPLLLVYKINMYCKQNKIRYEDFFKELLTHSPADKMVPDSSTTIREQLGMIAKHKKVNDEMIEKGFINAREADFILGRGNGKASYGVLSKQLKCTRVGSLMYFRPDDIQSFKTKLDKTAARRNARKSK